MLSVAGRIATRRRELDQSAKRFKRAMEDARDERARNPDPDTFDAQSARQRFFERAQMPAPDTYMALCESIRFAVTPSVADDVRHLAQSSEDLAELSVKVEDELSLELWSADDWQAGIMALVSEVTKTLGLRDMSDLFRGEATARPNRH